MINGSAHWQTVTARDLPLLVRGRVIIRAAGSPPLSGIPEFDKSYLNQLHWAGATGSGSQVRVQHWHDHDDVSSYFVHEPRSRRSSRPVGVSGVSSRAILALPSGDLRISEHHHDDASGI
jgi:hypothetical protein